MAVPHPNAAAIEWLQIEKARLKQGLVAQNTVLGYGYDMRMYAAWCERYHRSALPTTAETLSLYLTDLLSHGKKITTARRRQCAVLHAHRSHGLEAPDVTEVRALLRGAQRLRAEKPRQMRPITVCELRKMSGCLLRIGSIAAMRNRALLVIGFASTLRRSNLALLNLSDVEFCRQGLVIHVEREKQDQEGRGRFIGIARGRYPNTDPVRVLKAWLRVRGTNPGPLFPRVTKFRRGERLDGECICRIVKKCLAGIGIDPRQSGAHSLRAGAITAMGEANVSALRISAYTAQTPEIVRRYFRRADIWRNNASVSLGL